MCTRTIKLFGVIFFFVLFAASIPAFCQQPDVVSLEEGASSVFYAPFDVMKIAIGDPDICKAVKTSDREFLINAQGVGSSNIIFWGPNDETKEVLVKVSSRNVSNVVSELKELLKGIEGVRVRSVGSRVAVEGEVFQTESLEKVNKMVEGYPNVLNLVELSPLMQKIVKEEIEKALQDEGLKKVYIKTAKNKFILAGKVANEADFARAELIAKAYSADIANAIQISAEASYEASVLIEMSMSIMEVERDALRDLGVNWGADVSVGGSGTYSGQSGQSPSLQGALSGTVSNLLPKMQKIQEKGMGRNLMQQSLVTKSGDTAKFFAGSEIPIAVAQEGGTMSVEYKKVGVTLNFTPTLDSYNNITSPINIESSSVTGEGPGGAPILNNTQLNTVVSVKSGESIALGGLVGQKDFESKSNSGPEASTIQANSGSRRGSESREVVIFVTPRALTGSEKAIEAIQEKVEDSFKEQELEKLRDQLK